jgi:hypothetical protein
LRRLTRRRARHLPAHHHNQSIFGKLEVSTRGAAVLFAIEQGLI